MTPLWAERQHLAVDAESDRPLRFLWEGRYHQVERISRHWRVHLDWWAPSELWRDYWEATTDSGLLCVIYRDLIAGDWSLERIYP